MAFPELKRVDPKSWKAQGKEWLGVFAFQGTSTAEILSANGDITSQAKSLAEEGFQGEAREVHLSRPYIFIGLGKRTEFSSDSLRQGAAQLIHAAKKLKASMITLEAPPEARKKDAFQALAEGLLLGSYRFDRYQKKDEDAIAVREVRILAKPSDKNAEQALRRAQIYSRATTLARDLINEPPSVMNPERLASEALKLKNSSISVQVFEKKDLEKMGMGGILGVGAGGAVPPRLVELIYKPSGKAKKVIALVGKGITFDSGGLSLKPAQGMETMKDDMSGAAAVLGVFSALAELKPQVEVRGYTAIAENMPGGRAQKPGDVLKTYKGKTIEVLNTDAEGRLVLADALSYASSKKPDIIIDIATLTGAAVVALGHLVSAIMTPAPKLTEELIEAGESAGEQFWPLPLVKEYQKDIKSKIADLKNIGGRRGEAGTIIGGLFLQEFVEEGPTWAHIDIAGPSWTDSDQPYCPTGGTGHPVRTLLHYLEAQ